MGIRRQGSGGRKHVPEEEEASLKSQKRRRGRESSRRRLSGEGGGGGVREGKRHSRMIYGVICEMAGWRLRYLKRKSLGAAVCVCVRSCCEANNNLVAEGTRRTRTAGEGHVAKVE